MWGEGNWPETSDPLVAGVKDTVAVYLLPLQAPDTDGAVEHCLSLLPEAEQLRWREFRLPERGWQYLQSRVLQRRVLGSYVAREPGELVFVRNQWGRPRLANHDRIHFNLSHCASHVALAVGTDPLLGIDVESTLPLRRNFMHIAKQQFNDIDLMQLMACPEELRYVRFLELWTLKEAYLKALGFGMHKPMADSTFVRDTCGAWRCHDRALAVLPLDFLSERDKVGCQLALAYRDHYSVALRYLPPATLQLALA